MEVSPMQLTTNQKIRSARCESILTLNIKEVNKHKAPIEAIILLCEIEPRSSANKFLKNSNIVT